MKNFNASQAPPSSFECQLDCISQSISQINFGLLTASSEFTRGVRLSDELRKFVHFLPGSVFIEDLNGRFLAINNYGAQKIIGLNDHEEIIGKSHDEISRMGTWQVSQQEVNLWRGAKEQVMLEERPLLPTQLDPYLIADGSLILQTGCTIPVYNSGGKVVGAFTIALDATNQLSAAGICRSYRVLYPNKKKALQSSLKHLTGNKYPLFKELTARELDCLIQLTSGYNAKQIANHFNLSRRTVETYIQSIKEKVGITDKMRLIKCFLDASTSFNPDSAVGYLHRSTSEK